MCIKVKLLLLLAITVLGVGATTVSFVGPVDPTTGLTCNPTAVGCILGDPASYAIYGVQLTSPTASNQPWTLTIETNYPVCVPGTTGCTLSHVIATPGSII